MKSTLFTFICLLLVFSCSKDNANDINPNNVDVSGRFLAPNNLDPIVNAKVSVVKNNTVVFETVTNANGEYTLAIPVGDYTINLTKGLFSTQKNITVEEDIMLDTYRIENIPSIAVVTGDYDNIENILYSIGLVDLDTGLPLFDIIDGTSFNRIGHPNNHANHVNHGHNDSESFSVARNNPMLTSNVDFNYQVFLNDPELLDNYDIIFINCGSNTGSLDGGQNLYDYVNNGGYLYATDWAARALGTITNNNADFVSFLVPERSGNSLSTTATILDGDLSAWLLTFGIGIDDTIYIDEFLPSWQVIESFDAQTTTSWLNGPVIYSDDSGTSISENKDLAVTFPLGNGGVLYSSFHTENSNPDFTTTDRVMEFMVFEMTDQ
ncbi:carboxypeptidase-like regulatory domain-containing protein [Psychroserpens sp. AS72]|uniref:carboxypeptidase-like regulatory domain-containing protein n=1 Tax=Psychroserpens sp. AS72 TaxID=3135775 RepID=UPI003172F34C